MSFEKIDAQNRLLSVSIEKFPGIRATHLWDRDASMKGSIIEPFILASLSHRCVARIPGKCKTFCGHMLDGFYYQKIDFSSPTTRRHQY